MLNHEALLTIEKMLESLPKSVQHQVIEHLLKYIAEIQDEERWVKPVGGSLVLILVENPWQSLFDNLDKFSEDFLGQREQPESQVREHLFE